MLEKKEIVGTEALLQRHKKEIEDLNRRLAEREEAPTRNRRLSAREVRLFSFLFVRNLDCLSIVIANRQIKGHERPQLAHQATHETYSYEPNRRRTQRRWIKACEFIEAGLRPIHISGKASCSIWTSHLIRNTTLCSYSKNYYLLVVRKKSKPLNSFL